MCEGKRPNAREIIANLAAPMPLGRKISLLVKNNLSKLLNARTCCGHPGEPGC